jgi:Bacterial SH3 domain
LVSAKVNLRSGPGTDSEILTTIPASSTVQVGKCDGEWCAVTWNGQSGYAIARNLNLGGSRQAGAYPAHPGGYPEGGEYPPGVAYGPGYYGPYGPPVVYGPAYYYGPQIYYGPGWGWRRRW